MSVKHFGKSAWTITGRILAQDPDGSENTYFVKVRTALKLAPTDFVPPNESLCEKIAFGETGRIMLGRAFESSKLICSTMPEFIPKPFGYGRFKVQNPLTYF